MAAKFRASSKSITARRKWLSIVFAVELRLKIIVETYVRGEMSPIQFCRLFPNESRSRVDKNFKVLTKSGWLRYIRSEKGNGRRGGEEHFYRATALPRIDTETWATLPYSIRIAFSWNALKEIAEQVRAALEGAHAPKAGGARQSRKLASLAGPPGAIRASKLSRVRLQLDQLGWERVYGAVNARFEAAHEEQKDAQLRSRHSGESLVRAYALQIAFEASSSETTLPTFDLIEATAESMMPFSVRMSKVFSDDLCLEIVDAANRELVSVMSIYKKVDGISIDCIRTRFGWLEAAKLLTLVCRKSGGKRRGGHEKFYKATAPLMGATGPWADVPTSVRHSEEWELFEELSAEIKDAMAAGTFDARDDRYLAWSVLHLDQQGLAKVMAEMEDLRAEVLEEERCARERLRESGEQPIPTIVAIGAFVPSKMGAKAS